jgi:hypothetical protein
LFLVVFCIAVVILVGLACAFDQEGAIGVAAILAADPSHSRDEASRAPSARDAHRLLGGPVARTSMRASSLLAAVPGGLCLLI